MTLVTTEPRKAAATDFSNGQALTPTDVAGPAKSKPTKVKAKPKPKVKTANKMKPQASKPVKTKVKAPKIKTGNKADKREKPGLRTGQIRILRVLNGKPGEKHKTIALTQRDLAKRAKLTDGWTFNHVGSADKDNRAGQRERLGGAPTLLDLRAVTTQLVPIDGKDGREGKKRVFQITETGRSLLVRTEAALAERKAAKKGKK